MICEGTRIDKSEKDSEDAVGREMSKLIGNSGGLVFIEHPIRDIDRVTTILKAAQSNKRQLVVPSKLAYLIQSLDKYCPFTLEDIKIIIPPKEWGLIYKKREDWSSIVKEFEIAKEYEEWEKEFVQGKHSITCEELKKNPEKYVVSMNLWEINQLIDIKPKDAIWIKSSCEPFCEEMELDEKRKREWLNRFGIKEHNNGVTHASGHASGDEIRGMIKLIQPKNLIPIHTEHPELF